MDQTIADLAPAELVWIAQQQQAATRFVRTASGRDVYEPVTLADLDLAFKAWITKEPTDTDEINGVINAVGVAFGQYLVDGAGLKWVVATDQHGSELAVHGLPGAGDVLVYPANFVAKRWERRETDFLEKTYRQMSADIRLVAMEHAGRTSRPWWKFW
jgi:hypothetical protein